MAKPSRAAVVIRSSGKEEATGQVSCPLGEERLASSALSGACFWVPSCWIRRECDGMPCGATERCHKGPQSRQSDSPRREEQQDLGLLAVEIGILLAVAPAPALPALLSSPPEFRLSGLLSW